MCAANVTHSLPASVCAGVASGPNARAASSSRRANLFPDVFTTSAFTSLLCAGSNGLNKLTFASARYPAARRRARRRPSADIASAAPKSNAGYSVNSWRRVCLAAVRSGATSGFACSPIIGTSTRAAAPASWFTSSILPPTTSAPKRSGAKQATHARRARPLISAPLVWAFIVWDTPPSTI